MLSMAFGENNDYRRVSQMSATAARVSSRSSLKSLTTHVHSFKETTLSESKSPISGIADIILTEENTNSTAEITSEQASQIVETQTETVLADIREILQPENNELQGLKTGILIEAIQSSIELEVGNGTNNATQLEPNEITLSDYTSWLLHRAHSIDATNMTQESEIQTEKSDGIRNTFMTSTESILIHHQKQVTQTNWSVIDRFIETEPQIAKGKAGSYSQGDLTRGSFKEEEEFYTETMARILAQQGKSEKARMVFKKLMELYPEKSIYFAAQLKNLDLIKNK